MPLYEYECEACGRRFEQIRKFSDPPVDVCPHCGERSVRKLLSSPAIQFKGSGWYITDYARKNAASTDPAAKPAAKDGETKSSPSDTSKSSSSTGSTDTAPATPSSKQS